MAVDRLGTRVRENNRQLLHFDVAVVFARCVGEFINHKAALSKLDKLLANLPLSMADHVCFPAVTHFTWSISLIPIILFQIDLESLVHELPEWFKWDLPPKAETTTTEQAEDDLNFNIFHDESNMQYLDESYINLHKEEIRRPPKESPKLVFERTGPDTRLVSVGDVAFVVRNEAFERGSLRLTCIASIYNLYAARAELIFDMEQPEVASVLGVRNCAIGELQFERPIFITYTNCQSIHKTNGINSTN